MTLLVEKTVVICNRRGLHARAAAKFVKMAETFTADISVAKDGAQVCATSIMGLLMLAASIHTSIHISAKGEGAESAVESLAALVESRFGEDE